MGNLRWDGDDRCKDEVWDEEISTWSRLEMDVSLRAQLEMGQMCPSAAFCNVHDQSLI